MRSTPPTAGTATRRELLLAARMITIDIPVMPLPQLVKRSVAHYNARNPGKRAADYTSDPRFVARICVNFLRHQGTGYDRDRDFVTANASAADRAAVGATIKGRVLRAIAETYPQLADEARRQAEREDAPPPPRPQSGRRAATLNRNGQPRPTTRR